MSQEEVTIFCVLHSCREFGQKEPRSLTAEHPQAPRTCGWVHLPGVRKQSSSPQKMSAPADNVSDGSSTTCPRERKGRKATKTKVL